MRLRIGALAWLSVVAPAFAAGEWVFEDRTLDNGLRVIVMEDHSSPLVAVQVWYHVGSKDENPNRQGFAHMFEHMMFRGTDRLGPEDHFKYLRRFGGEVNGFTTFDTTAYIQVVPSNQLALVFWLEAERMANLKINEAYFAAEREVVKEEYRKGHDRPYGSLLETALPFVFRKHSYRWSPIGNLEHLDAATADELRAFFKTYYVPNNATVVVVGDVIPEEVFAQAENYFGWVPRGDDPPSVSDDEPEPVEARRLETYEKAPLPLVGVGFLVPPASDKDTAALNVLQNIMSSGQSGRMYKRLVKESELCMAAGAGMLPMEHHSLFGFGGALRMGSKPESVEAIVLSEIDRLKSEGVETRELEKAKNQARSAAVRERMTVAGKARKLGYAATVLGDPDRVNSELDDILSVTQDDVKRVANTYFTDNARMTLIVRPELSRVTESFGFLRGLVGGGDDDDKKEDDAPDAESGDADATDATNGDTP